MCISHVIRTTDQVEMGRKHTSPSTEAHTSSTEAHISKYRGTHVKYGSTQTRYGNTQPKKRSTLALQHHLEFQNIKLTAAKCFNIDAMHPPPRTRPKRGPCPDLNRGPLPPLARHRAGNSRREHDTTTPQELVVKSSRVALRSLRSWAVCGTVNPHGSQFRPGRQGDE